MNPPLTADDIACSALAALTMRELVHCFAISGDLNMQNQPVTHPRTKKRVNLAQVLVDAYLDVPRDEAK